MSDLKNFDLRNLRDGGDLQEDAYANDARLFELDFHYQTNKSGTKNEIPS
jgi:hypothetical protein